MLRMRRYRAFLLLATLCAVTFYYLVNVRHATLPDVKRFRQITFGHTSSPGQQTDHQTESVPLEHRPDPHPELAIPPPADPEVELPPSPTTTLRRFADSKLNDFNEYSRTSTATNAAVTTTGEELLSEKTRHGDDLKEINKSQWEVEHISGDVPQSRWQPQEEHNPIPAHDLIKLPTGKRKDLAKVQFEFIPESNTEKAERLKKLVAIRESFKHAWEGYVKFAMPHDEVLPVSKSYSDSFMGWGATLIDSLDSLWIMDLKEDFEMAVNATRKIDFQTSHKKEIPIFETVIRILGGLISAYDLSNEQYPILLTKAVELADILMGAFDTPNRMPDMYYKWAPSYASQQHRSGTRVVVAELGSLSLEFTRLAQITKQPKYYDAIARVQNALEEWQMNTEMPGLWPLNLDASGCQKVDKVKVQADSVEGEKPILLDSAQLKDEDLPNGPMPPYMNAKDPRGRRKRQADDISIPAGHAGNGDTGDGRQHFSLEKLPAIAQKQGNPSGSNADDLYCKVQGLTYEPYSKKHTYSIAAQADSTYEYMPKMHRLLGGLTSQYENMYVNAAKTMRTKVFYRPLIEDANRKILFPAAYEFDLNTKIRSRRVKTVWEATHLGCYAGGMFGLAARTFNIPSDITVAKQLTDGCVWAYESTPTKIMPESFTLTSCEDPESCAWEEVMWHKALDPNLKERMDAVDAWNKEQKKLFQQTRINVAKKPQDVDAPSKPVPTVFKGRIAKENDRKDSKGLRKRDPPVNNPPTKVGSALYEDDEVPLEQFGFQPKVAMSHDKYVKARILEERLPPGYTKIYSRKYILRPEAIESVFMMWRITGEQYWREKGWDMFQAIQEATHTGAGNAGLEDVTSILGEKIDKMESFWLAETLKYFYLLFSEPSVVSLDDYVLNTEAHPFRVPAS